MQTGVRCVPRRVRAVDSLEVPGSRRGFADTQRKAGSSANSRDFDLMELYVLMANILNGTDVENSFRQMIEITQSAWFDEQTEIQFEASFIKLLKEYLEKYRKGEINASVVTVVMQLLTNIWYVNRFDNVLIDDELIDAVVQMVLAPDDVVVAYAFSCMANLAGYMPELFWRALESPDVIARIQSILQNEKSSRVLDPLLRFLLSEARSTKKELLSPLVPGIPHILDCPVIEIKGLVSALIYELIDDEKRYEMFLEQEALFKLLSALVYSDAARAMPIFGCFVIFMKHDVLEAFTQPEFMKQVQNLLIQVTSIRAQELYDAIRELISHNQAQCLYENGVIETILATASRMTFVNRQFAAVCISEFLEAAPLEIKMNVAKHGAFRLICEVVTSLTDQDVLRVMPTCLRFIESDDIFCAIANTADLQQSLESLTSSNDDVNKLKEIVIKALKDRVANCDERVYAEIERLEKDTEVFDDGDISCSDGSTDA